MISSKIGDEQRFIKRVRVNNKVMITSNRSYYLE